MRIEFYGVRGSLPVCGREFERYGGTQPASRSFGKPLSGLLLLMQVQAFVIFRKGDYRQDGLSQNIINILFYFHLDHIQGLPYFAPAYNKEQRIGILAMGRRGKIKNLKEIFSTQMHEEYFPIGLDMMGRNLSF